MAMYERRATRQIHIGNIPIGGGAPISVQSMCNTKTTDTEATVQQIRELAAAGGVRTSSGTRLRSASGWPKGFYGLLGALGA